ncbi:hypothetical protein [Halorussus sp. MSC15.2]|uniref:hypothetical protein n=1 Tax=Halorussus sp. MSC15.2 TaxID=2283638 RepID=UPI0013D7A5D7|nr:hypothetical protein [Halorussus sp. MSC15.2]NEU56821.1 hypothetical protein [Halorussus sp. MSC15.2]
MHRFHLYHGSMAIIGAAIGSKALLSAAADGVDAPIVLMALGGGGLAVASMYTVFARDPEESAIPAYAVLGAILGAVFSVLGVVVEALA